MAVTNGRAQLAHGMESRAGEVIDVRGLRMRYGSRDVLDGVDLTVSRGEVLVLLGPNGAGKTTTIEILEGFRSRSAGEVSGDGSTSRSASSAGPRCCSSTSPPPVSTRWPVAGSTI